MRGKVAEVTLYSSGNYLFFILIHGIYQPLEVCRFGENEFFFMRPPLSEMIFNCQRLGPYRHVTCLEPAVHQVSA